ncbi:hypothetical protein OPQ81_002636 [Rhizoctonia solani]|nr:hypothetical protein OPQ81_002636 [Rhizoctonia solani]
MSSPVGKLQKEKPLVKRIQPPFTRMTTLEGHPIRAADGSRCQRQLEVRSGELHQRDPRQETHMPEVSKPSSSSSSGKLLWLLKRKGSYECKQRGNNEVFSPSRYPVPTQDRNLLSLSQSPHFQASQLHTYDPDRYIKDQDRRIQARIRRLEEQEIELRSQACELDKLQGFLDKREGHIAQLKVNVRLVEELEQELSVVYQHLGISDEGDPKALVNEFGDINKMIERISRALAVALGKNSPVRALATSDLIQQFCIHLDCGSAASLTASHHINPDQFIELGCRAILNAFLVKKHLNHKVYDLDWEPSTNDIFYNTYRRIQQIEAQVNAGKWRISTLNSIQNADISTRCRADAKELCDETLIPFCQVAYDKESCSSAKEAILPSVIALLEKAHAWNYRTRSTVLLMDFEAIYFWPGERYNSKWAKQEDAEVKPTAADTIMLTIQLGLRTCEALEDGDRQYIRRIPAMVLAVDSSSTVRHNCKVLGSKVA